jgi:hypothetical protein
MIASVAVIVAICASAVYADDLTVTYSVPTVSTMSLDSDMTFTLATPAAGGSFSAVHDSFGVNASDNTGTPKKITAQLDSSMPSGCTLSATAGAGLGTPLSGVVLDDTARSIITDINYENGSSTIDTSFIADLTAEPLTEGTRTLTITMTDNS